MSAPENSLEAIASGSRFLSSTVHEMRTPIQTIIGSLELLKLTKLDKEQKEYVHQMQVGADTLLALANDILDFTKIRSKEFRLEKIEFNLIDVVERVMDSISNEAFSKGLEVVSDIYTSVPKYIVGDPTRLQQILLNIAKNAAKFTERGYIHCIVERSDERTLLFKVEDSGIGISEDARKKLFTDFYQADTSTTRKYGGTGLGLSICKSLVAAMDGKIGVDMNPSGGSIFWFTIPCIEAERGNSAFERFKSVKVPDDTRILLVDDSFLARKSFELKLKNCGLPFVSTAENGEEALRLMQDAAGRGEPFTLVFIDMLMPKMDGWRLASEINADRTINLARLYLIVPEGQLQQDAKMRLLNWFNGYLYKPIKIQRLEEVLNLAFSDSMQLADEAEIKVSGDKIADGVLVLVAEDHPVNQKLIVTFLKKMGAAVLEAQNGKEAVELYSSNPDIDIVFMDVQMPVLNGLDATRQLRQSGYGGVIVACTANHSDSDLVLYNEAGMNDTLGKPYKSDDLKKIISKWKPSFGASLSESGSADGEPQQKAGLIWDAADFEDTIDGDFDLGAQLIFDFTEQTEKLVNEIPSLVQAGDYESLRKTGHTLKGSAATISAFTISNHGYLLNQAAHEQDNDELLRQGKILSEELIKFIEAAEKWKKEHGLEDELSYTHDFL